MKVFWSRCGHGHGNFGDKLTPLFLDYFRMRYRWAPAEQADIIGIGSLIEKVPQDFRGVIWSTGCMFSETRSELAAAEVLAVRGKLTLERLTCNTKAEVALGDGGLLCDLFFQPTSKKYQLGLIPHFADQQDANVSALASSSPEIALIDICGPTLEVIQQVGECEYILSSSLHGLILADSLGVPNHWMELGTSVLGGGFKFHDYYSAFGLTDKTPVYPVAGDTLQTILARCAPYDRPGISTIKAGLMSSLERLVVRFGGDPRQRISLAELREREQRAADDRAAWNAEVRCSLELLEKHIPQGERFILIDDEQLRGEVTHAQGLPLIGRDGEYWGAPENDEQAVSELKRHLCSGIRYVAFAENCFWWLESYPGFAELLHTTSEVICTTPKLRLFQVRASR